jgi:hypothetical protein
MDLNESSFLKVDQKNSAEMSKSTLHEQNIEVAFS